MRRQIKVALCVRVAALLAGPGLYCLLTNSFINDDKGNNNIIPPASDGRVNNRNRVQCELHAFRLLPDYALRRLLNVRNEPTPDEPNELKGDGARLVTIKFPSDRLMRAKWKILRTVFQVLASCYCFWMLAIICDEYFIGSIDVLCQSLCTRLFG